MIEFICSLVSGRRAVEIPGTKNQLRIRLEVAETELPRALPLILERGKLLHLSLTSCEDPGDTIRVWASISPMSGALRIDGREGMAITLDLPGSPPSLPWLLNHRETNFIVKDITNDRTDSSNDIPHSEPGSST